MEPAEPGAGYSFESAIVGGAIPKEYIPSIDNGIQEAAKSGIVGGYEVVDFKVTLTDGSYHEVDSSEMAFKIAGSMALKDALERAGSVLLEPIMKVEVVIPEDYLGDVLETSTPAGAASKGRRSAAARRPCMPWFLSEMFGYATDLRSRTQGRGTYTMQFSHYEQVPKSIAEKNYRQEITAGRIDGCGRAAPILLARE